MLSLVMNPRLNLKTKFLLGFMSTPPTLPLEATGPPTPPNASPVLRRSDTRPLGMKRPRHLTMYPESPSSGSEEDLPDLSVFFDDAGTIPEDRIRICRTYASYLTSLKRKK